MRPHAIAHKSSKIHGASEGLTIFKRAKDCNNCRERKKSTAVIKLIPIAI